jgi:hypothetical protein
LAAKKKGIIALVTDMFKKGIQKLVAEEEEEIWGSFR